MTTITISGATLANPSAVIDPNLQVVLGLTTFADLGYTIRDGENLGKPGEKTQSMATSLGVTAEALYDAYLVNPLIASDRDGDGVTGFSDLEAYLNSVTEPTVEFVEFLESVDSELAKLHVEVYEHTDDAHAKQTSKSATGSEKYWKVESAGADYVAAQAAYRDRLVSVLQGIYGTAAVSKGDAVGQTLTHKGVKDWKIGGIGSEDNITFNGTTYDILDLETGEFSLKKTDPAEDIYSMKVVDEVTGIEVIKAAGKGAVVGAVSGAAAGALIGLVGGPIGAGAGLIIGLVVGAAVGFYGAGGKKYVDKLWNWVTGK